MSETGNGNTSLSPIKGVTLTLKPEKTIIGAIGSLIEGHKITRKAWGDVRHYGLMKDGILQIHKAGEAEEITHPWILSDGDLLGDDYYVYG